jgi:ankyrin repeat protein
MSPYLAEQYSFSQQGFPHGAGPAWYGSSRTNLSFRKPVSSQDVYWKRFLQIFHDICGITQPPLPSLLLRNETPVSSPEDAVLAEELFLQEARKVTRSKTLWNRSQRSIESKNYSLATVALIRLVEENGRPGVACYLVRKGGTIMLSKDPQKQAIQIAERHNWITHATNLQREWLVDFFATINPPERLAGAFALAFKSGNVDLVRILLQRGASPDSLFQSVPNHFDTLDTAMLELLLQAPTLPSNTTRERWLSAAVAQGKMDLAITLLRYGTCQSLEYLNVLRKAIEELHIEAFLLALKFMHDSGAMEFDGLLPQIVGCHDMNFANKIIALEAILCVSNSKEARILHQRLRIPSSIDQDASEALHLCASSGQIALIELLRNPNFNTNVLSTTLFSAIEACDLHLLDHLYPPGAPTTLPTNFSLSTFPNIQDSATHERLLRRLLQLQIPGIYLDKELLNAISEHKGSAIRMLLDAGASVNYNGGQALLLAIGSQNVRLVQALLPHSTGETRKAVFPELRAAEKLPRRLMSKNP